MRFTKMKSMPPSIHSHIRSIFTDATTRKRSPFVELYVFTPPGASKKRKEKKQSTCGVRNMFFGLNFEVLIYCACFNYDIRVHGLFREHSRSENILGPPRSTLL